MNNKINETKFPIYTNPKVPGVYLYKIKGKKFKDNVVSLNQQDLDGGSFQNEEGYFNHFCDYDFVGPILYIPEGWN